MTIEKEFLLQVLSDHLAGKTTEQRDELDWEELSKLSHSHQVEGIVYCQCREFMPTEKLSFFEQAFGATVYYYTNRKMLMNKIAFVLNGKNIFFFTIKGFLTAQFYPIPALRTMGDCDIVIHRDDMLETVRALNEIGFHGSDIITVQQWGCIKDGLLFEIHNKLVQEGEYATKEQERFFNGFDRYIKGNKLDESFHFLFLLMHLRKHFLNCGVGIRQFMDLAAEIKNNKELQWGWIRGKLDDLGLLEFAIACFELIHLWLGISCPIEEKRLSEDDSEELMNKILDNGVFGFHDIKNRSADTQTAISKMEGPKWMRTTKYLITKTFPRYEDMRGYNHCGFLDNNRWLLPLAWCVRFAQIFFRKDRARTITTIKSGFIPNAEIEKRKVLLKKMKLL